MDQIISPPTPPASVSPFAVTKTIAAAGSDRIADPETTLTSNDHVMYHLPERYADMPDYCIEKELEEMRLVEEYEKEREAIMAAALGEDEEHVADDEQDSNACDKECCWGHPCAGKKDETKCPPCDINVLIEFKKCGHRMLLPCFLGSQRKYRANCHKLFLSPWSCIRCGGEVRFPCYFTQRSELADTPTFCMKCADNPEELAALAEIKLLKK